MLSKEASSFPSWNRRLSVGWRPGGRLIGARWPATSSSSMISLVVHATHANAKAYSLQLQELQSISHTLQASAGKTCNLTSCKPNPKTALPQ